MHIFEALFDIPAHHKLKEVSFTGGGTIGLSDKWQHEEYNAQGDLVALYLTWSTMDMKKLQKRTGFKKFSPSGQLLAEHEGIPIRQKPISAA